MHQGHRLGLAMGLLLALESACGRARTDVVPVAEGSDEAGQREGGKLEGAACNPLQSSVISASLERPLGVARDRSGTLYAVSQVGSRSIGWSSLDGRMIAYPVIEEATLFGATIFGVDDGSDGFALTLNPASDPATVRLFRRLEDAVAAPGTGSTVGGTYIDVAPQSALEELAVDTGISPVQLVGFYQVLSGIFGDGRVDDLMLVRREIESDDALAVFYGSGGVLRQQPIIDVCRKQEGIDVDFWLEGVEVSAHIDASGANGASVLRTSEGEQTLRSTVRTPRGLSHLRFQCVSPVPEDWRPYPPSAPPLAERCGDRQTLFSCVESSAAVMDVAGEITVDVAVARIGEIGSGIPPEAAGECAQRVSAEADRDPDSVRLWARLDHDGGETWLAIAGPEQQLPFQMGDSVSLAFRDHRARGGFEVELRSERDELLLWLGHADSLFTLRGTPDFELTPGPELCSKAEICRGRSQYALDSWQAGGEARVVGYGEGVQQDAYSIYNGGIDVWNGTPFCEDVAPAQASAAIWKNSAAP
jgi:hypothetical protein